MDEMKNNVSETEEGAAQETPFAPPAPLVPPVPEQVQPPVNTESVPVQEVPYEQAQNPVYQQPEQQRSGYIYYPQGYNVPQNTQQFASEPQGGNFGGYNMNGVPNAQQPDDKNGSANRGTNHKGRKIFLIVLAVVVVISAVAIPVALSGKLNFAIFSQPEEETKTQSKDNEKSTVPENSTSENAPSLDLNNAPTFENTNTVGDVLTPEQVYEKIAASNVAVMVYEDNQLYTEGTGIVMKEDDAGEYTYILTCAHVISDNGVELAIQMEDGTRYDAEVVGYDLRTDIGVVRIKASGLKVAEFGDSDSLKVGSTIYAIGNPGGSALFGTFTDGKVSAIGRSITSSIGYDMVCIQHNAAISPGNSGGALVNEYGQVIGINSSKIAATEFEGISFSIPITQAKDVINKLMAHGYVPGRPKLGISYVENDSPEISSIYGMAVQMKGLPSGSLVIYSISDDSDLKNTKAKPGDMITAVNGKNLDTADVLLELIENSKVGDELELSIFRIESSGGKYNTEEFTVKVKLIEENKAVNQ